MPRVECYTCGQSGHRQANCPTIECHHCHQRGHTVWNCPTKRQQQPNQQRRPQRSRNTDQRMQQYVVPPSADTLPSHWKLTDDYHYNSVSNATAALQRTGKRHVKCEVDYSELEEVKSLVQKTWRQNAVGKGVDGMNLSHSGIEVVKVERIENPSVYGRYSNKRQTLVQSQGDTDLLQNVRTWNAIAQRHGGVLSNSIYPPINEHYLFHGTKAQNVTSIAENGFNINMSRGRSLVGAGHYFTECSTKADMYADDRNNRTRGPKHMFLVRVLLGDPYMHTSGETQGFRRPPCKTCSKDNCSCYSGADRFDSVVNDGHFGFRGFVVYDDSQCYPEYLVTYQRIHEDDRAASAFSYVDTTATYQVQQRRVEAVRESSSSSYYPRSSTTSRPSSSPTYDYGSSSSSRGSGSSGEGSNWLPVVLGAGLLAGIAWLFGR